MPVEVRRWVFIHVVCFMRHTASSSSTVVFFFFDFGKRNCARCGQRLSPEAPVHSVLGLGPDKL